MTKLQIVLELPAARGLAALPMQRVECSGVVVRQDRLPMSQEPSFLTAIFFSEIKEEDRRRIGEFILRSMFDHDRRRS